MTGMKHLFAILCAITALSSCDSGDIYPAPPRESNRRIEASFTLEGLDAYPESEYYQLVFAAFESDGQYPLAFSAVPKPSGEIAAVTLPNVPDGAQIVSLALLDKSKKLICHFYTYPIAGMGEQTLTLPGQTVALNGYARVQRQLFSIKCVACHGGADVMARGLNLTEGYSYAALVDVDSKKNPTMKLAMPGSTLNSFIVKALTEPGALSTDHTEIVREDDVNLLRSWITGGCEE